MTTKETNLEKAGRAPKNFKTDLSVLTDKNRVIDSDTLEQYGCYAVVWNALRYWSTEIETCGSYLIFKITTGTRKKETDSEIQIAFVLLS